MNDELRLATRSVAKNPGFSLLAVGTLAIGIAATVLTFSMVNAVLLRPFPAVEPEALVALNEYNSSHGYSAGQTISYANFVDWRRDNRTLSSIALYKGASYTLNAGNETEHVDASDVTAGFFETFGVQPALGRTFTVAEESASAARVVVLSHDCWVNRFAADPAVIGRTLKLDAESFTVIGVMPPAFRFPDRAALWTPVRLDATDDLRGSRSFQGVGRLKPGVTVAQAQADLNVIARRIADAHPSTNALYAVSTETFVRQINGSYERSVLTLFGAVSCVLAITCVNIASLLLARAASREREMAVRLALGSSRTRIIAQLLLENLMIGLAGGAVGTTLAAWGLELLPRLLPADMPYWYTFTIDRPALAFALGVSVIASFGAGMVPAWQLSRVNVNAALKQGGRSGSPSRARLMRILVGAELICALVLLSAAGLLVKSLLQLQSVRPGFDAHGLLTFRLTLPAATYPDSSRQRLASQQLVEALRAVPGVSDAALVSDLPLSNSDWGRSFTIAGQPAPTPGHVPIALNRVVSAGYFATMRMPLVLGRGFTDHDTASTTAVAVVDRTFVQRFFPHEDPLGQRVRYGGARPDNHNPWMEIVGVVGDVRHGDLQNSNPGPGLYVPIAQQPASYGMYLALRTDADPHQLTTGVRAALTNFNRDLAMSDIATMEERVRNATSRDRVLGQIFGGFAAVALVLAALGVYGVTAFATAQRRREFGVRIALGAQAYDVFRLVIGEGMRLAGTAIVAGLVIAALVGRVLASQLYQTSPVDPLVLVTGVALLLAIAAGATWLPARRATKADPLESLRAE